MPLLLDVMKALTEDLDAEPSAVFHHAVTITAWTTRRDTLRRLLDPAESYTRTFDWLRTSLPAMTQTEAQQTARAIWLRLWPAHIALHSSFRGYTGYHSGHAHDLTLPVDIQDWYPRPTTLQTARDYFACTGDDQLSAFAKAGTRMANCPRGHEYLDVVVTSDQRDRTPCPSCTAAHVEHGVNDLASVAPDIASQLHPTLNGDLKATGIAAASSHRVWWKCAKNHPFIATPANRTLTGAGCGVCLNRTLISGVNDFATLHPFMALQLQRPSMSSKRANQLSADDTKMRDWVCPDGHPFRSTIKKRVSTRGTCPECQKVRRRTSPKNFAHTHPDKARTWLPELNEGRRPDEYTKGSKLDVIWWCENGQHPFEMRLEARSRGCGCPYCAGRRILAGFNDFATTHPDLAVDWHPYLNWKQPTEVMAGSIDKFYWKCRHGDITHQSIPKRRLSGGCVDCPVEERAGSLRAGVAESVV